jgi:hypothetical protein
MKLVEWTWKVHILIPDSLGKNQELQTSITMQWIALMMLLIDKLKSLIAALVR